MQLHRFGSLHFLRALIPAVEPSMHMMLRGGSLGPGLAVSYCFPLYPVRDRKNLAILPSEQRFQALERVGVLAGKVPSAFWKVVHMLISNNPKVFSHIPFSVLLHASLISADADVIYSKPRNRRDESELS
jgi:hypothetical protein